MTYNETVNYLFNSAPLFQQVGGAAYKEGLENTRKLDAHFNYPHRKFRTIHIAGTNGKGSCSHTLAAILQESGYKTGLYTSPHLIDFRERIRINGKPVSEEFVVDFVKKEKSFFEQLYPSFFELTTAMAFTYFAQENIDVAIIEVGLGGRLDCTNIISPDLCIITNISFDHVQFLGDTLEKIAYEKAGIIKPHTPIIIGECTDETKKIFLKKAKEEEAPIIFAEKEKPLKNAHPQANGYIYDTEDYQTLYGELSGDYQIKNTNTILTSIRQLKNSGYNITEAGIRNGFSKVCEITGLMGRWQYLHKNPTIVCDAGHNIGGITYVVNQLKRQQYANLRIVFGMVNDKEIDGVLSIMPKNAIYYFTQATVKRALPATEMKKKAEKYGLKGYEFPSVEEALRKAEEDSDEKDFIFIGGSCFIVADLLSGLKRKENPLNSNSF